MLENGFISLHRSILKWEWYDDINTVRLFIHLLLTVNHYDEQWRGVNICRGQRITSRLKLAKELSLTEQQVRTAISHLKSTNEITISSTPKYTVFTISQYDKYQIPTNKTPNIQPTTNQLPTNYQPQSNKANKAIIDILLLGSQKNIKLTAEEKEKLLTEFPLEAEEAIEYLSLYVADNGDKSKAKTHNLTIRRWVIDAIKERHAKGVKTTNKEVIIKGYQEFNPTTGKKGDKVDYV